MTNLAARTLILLSVLFMFVAPSFLGQTSAASVTTLATNQSSPSNLVVYKGYVYWTTNEVISRVPISGGIVSQVYKDASILGSFIVHGSTVYFYNNTGMYSVPVTGGASKLILKFTTNCNSDIAPCFTNLRLYGNYIYFISQVSPNIERVPVGGGKATVVYKGSGTVPGEYPEQITISGGYIYWLSGIGGTGLPGIGRVTLSGGNAKVLYTDTSASCGTSPLYAPGTTRTMFFVQSGFIYWGCQGSTFAVDKMTITGGLVTTLFKTTTSSSSYLIDSLAYNSGKIVFSLDYGIGTGSVSTGIYEMSTSGTGLTQLVSSPQPISVAASLGEVYYTDWGSSPTTLIGTVNVFTP
jgi:hypothetical protein